MRKRHPLGATFEPDHVAEPEVPCLQVVLELLEEVEEVCDRVIVIADGEIVADDTPNGLADEHGRLAASFRKLTARYESKGISV